MKVQVKPIVLVSVLLLVMIGLITFFGGLGKRFFSRSDGSDGSGQAEELVYQGKTYVLRPSVETLLWLGIDREGSIEVKAQASQQCDFIMLMVMDHNEKTITFLHINRDTMANVPIFGVLGHPAGYIYEQLALAHTTGESEKERCRNVRKAVSEFLFDIKIDHVVSFTMSAVPIVNDSVGGVELALLCDMTDLHPNYTEGTKVTLLGENALSYVRARMGTADGTNLNRMERQRQYVGALTSKLLTLEKEEQRVLISDILQQLQDHVYTDCTMSQITHLTERVQAYTVSEAMTLRGEAVKGEAFMEFYPNEASLRETILSLFYRSKE